MPQVLIPPSQFLQSPWKNGQGLTEQIAIHPPNVNFRRDPFVWRLSRATIGESCAFSQFPGYLNTLVLLPHHSHGTITNDLLRRDSQTSMMKLSMKLRHQKHEKLPPAAVVTLGTQTTLSATTGAALASLLPISVKDSSKEGVHDSSKTAAVEEGVSKTTSSTVVRPLIPYTYQGGWLTTAEISKPCQDITLMVNKQLAKADVSVETIDAESQFRKLLLATTTLLYCISGSMAIQVENDPTVYQLTSGHVFVCDLSPTEEGEQPTPLYLKAMTASSSAAAATAAVGGATPLMTGYTTAGTTNPASSTTLDDTTVFIFIQITHGSHLNGMVQTTRAESHPMDDIIKSMQQMNAGGVSQGSVVGSGAAAAAVPPGAAAVGLGLDKGSLVVYDDQPLWALPQDLADKMNIMMSKSLSSTSLAAAAAPVDMSPQVNPTIPLNLTPSLIYEPPEWSFFNFPNEQDVEAPTFCDSLNLEAFPRGKISCCWINMLKQGLSEYIRVPCIIARGRLSPTAVNSAGTSMSNDGMATATGQSDAESGVNGVTDVPENPDDIVVGITAALHGNEVNGVSCIQRLVAGLDMSRLRGTVVALPCMNPTGYLNFKREFSDGKDLNRTFPGHIDGTASSSYAYAIMEKIVNNFTYLIDLHTASFGRVNSYYVRADMNDPVAAMFAKLQQPQIILHNSGQDGTMRSAASQRGIKSITVEIGNPQQFQNQFINWSYQGLLNILNYLGMYPQDPTSPIIPRRAVQMDAEVTLSKKQPFPPVVCAKGFWTYTRTGGVLEVYPAVNAFVRKGLLVARIKNIFGNVVDEYFAPCDSMVIGRSSNPVAMTGDRIIHFGVPVKKGENLPAVAKENY